MFKCLKTLPVDHNLVAVAYRRLCNVVKVIPLAKSSFFNRLWMLIQCYTYLVIMHQHFAKQHIYVTKVHASNGTNVIAGEETIGYEFALQTTSNDKKSVGEF